MKAVALVVIAVFCTVHAGFSQYMDDEWAKGKVFLNNGDTLSGWVRYEESQEIIQYYNKTEDQGRVYTYSSFSIQGFQQAYLDTIRELRRFYWDGGRESTVPVPQFFEVCYAGKLTLLMKERKVRTMRDDVISTGVGGVQTMLPVYSEEIIYDFFLMDDEGNIEFVRKPSRFFREKYPAHERQIKEKARGISNIRPDREKMIDLIKAIEKMVFSD